MASALPASRSPFVFHVSGRSGAAVLQPLDNAGAMTAAIHPAMTFTGDPESEVGRMAGARFAITAGAGEAIERARDIVASLGRSEEHTSELQSLMRISYAVFCLNKKNYNRHNNTRNQPN